MKTLCVKLSKGCWYPTRMGYKRLEKEDLDKTQVSSAAVVATTRWRQRPRMKTENWVAVKLMSSITCPKKWLNWARDAYIRMMLHLATLSVYGMSYHEPPTGRSVSGLRGFGRVPLKEYDRKVIVESYMPSFGIIRRQLTPRDAII